MTARGMTARGVAYWAVPPLLMLALDWPGLTAWFQKDDFAWLGLRQLVHGPRDLLGVLFAPLAQGTIRTLSERAVYLSFSSLFGLHALPFRMLAFATCAAAIAMLCAVVTKLSGSRAAGFWAAIIWALNCGIAVPLAWTAVFYELAWAFWLLLTFWLLLRYVESGDRRFFIAQCVTFVLGFFVLELNVVYPAIAAAFAMVSSKARARGLFNKVLPLFAISIVYTIVHFWFAPLAAGGPYKLHWDARVFQTLVQYWGWALGPGYGRLLGIRGTLPRSTMVWALTAGLFAFLLQKFREREWVAALFPAWFLIVLAPLLPLRDHMESEYLTAPTLGLAMWAGWAIVAAWRAHWVSRIAAVLLLAIYAGISIPVGQAMVRSFHDESERIRIFVQSVVALARAQPEKIVLLEGVDTELFNGAVYDRAFQLYDINELCLVPENRATIAAEPYFAGVDPFFASPAFVEKAIRENRAVVLDVSSGTARDATAEYLAGLP